MKSTAEKKLRITLLHCRRGIAFVAVGGAMALSPATALAAGEESPEAAPAAPPASTGWVPQGSDSESSGGGTTEVRHGSSLGSGASPHQAQPESQETTTYTPPPSSSYEAPSPAVASEAPVTTVQTGSGTENVVEHPAVAPPVPKPSSSEVASVAVGSAVAVSQPKAPGGASDKGKVPEAAASSPSPHDQVSSSSIVLPVLAVLVCGLILIYAGARLVFGPVEPLRRY